MFGSMFLQAIAVVLTAFISVQVPFPGPSAPPDNRSPFQYHFPTVDFAEAAYMFFDEGGDVGLEFDPICELVWDSEAGDLRCTFPERIVRYSVQSDRTVGTGVLFGQGSDGSVWTIDLGQIDWAGPDRILSGSFSPLLTHEVGGMERSGMTSFVW